MKVLLSILAALCIAVTAFAQEPTQSPTRTVAQRRCCPRRLPTRITPQKNATVSRPPAESSSDFFVGEARVDVTKDETVVRLAMAQHGSVFIELPANDGPRYIVPGDPEMATVDEKALEKNKRAIVVRPGSLFLPPLPKARARMPAATVTVQMRSGLVVTFLFYPVENLAQNVHRCVLNYRRNEVVARRRAAGLPVNLDDKEQGGEKPTVQPAASTSIPVDTTTQIKDANKAQSVTLSNSVSQLADSRQAISPTVSAEAKSDNSDPTAEKRKTKTLAKAVTSTRNALKQAIKEPGQFKEWTEPKHGLAISVSKKRHASPDFTVITFAVRNMNIDPLKLTSETPDLFVEMLDPQGTSVNIEPIKKLHTEVSDVSGAIPAGGTVYYSMAYVSPILGVHQQVKIVVGQTNAADEPVSVKLANSGK